MSMMLNGMQTWLRQDCAEMGEIQIAGISVLDIASTLAGDIDTRGESVKFGTIGVAGYLDMLIQNANLVGKTNAIPDDNDRREAQSLIPHLQDAARKKEKALVIQDILRLQKIFTKGALEAVAECQCGNQGVTTGGHRTFPTDYAGWLKLAEDIKRAIESDPAMVSTKSGTAFVIDYQLHTISGEGKTETTQAVANAKRWLVYQAHKLGID
jgi:hypothetical protein